MHRSIKDAVRCPQEGCNSIREPEEFAWFCDTCKERMPDQGLELKVWRNNRKDDDLSDRVDEYDACSWECLFRKMLKQRNVDFVSLPLASADRRGRNQFSELKKFVKPMLSEVYGGKRFAIR